MTVSSTSIRLRSYRRASQVLAVQFEQVEGAEHGGSVMLVAADQVEHGEAVFVTDDSLAVDQA